MHDRLLMVHVLTVHYHRYCFHGSVTINIEWSAAVGHLFNSFSNLGCIGERGLAICGSDQTILLSFQSILCIWISICTTGEVDASSEINSVIMQISYQSCVCRTIVCNKKGLSHTVFTLALISYPDVCLQSRTCAYLVNFSCSTI